MTNEQFPDWQTDRANFFRELEIKTKGKYRSQRNDVISALYTVLFHNSGDGALLCGNEIPDDKWLGGCCRAEELEKFRKVREHYLIAEAPEELKWHVSALVDRSGRIFVKKFLIPITGALPSARFRAFCGMSMFIKSLDEEYDNLS